MYLSSFLIGGIFCLIGQILIDVFKLIPVKVACIYVVAGALLRIKNIYKSLINIAGAGALLPISCFGYTMTDAAVTYGVEDGIIGILKGPLTSTSIGISFAVLLAILMALIFKPKG